MLCRAIEKIGAFCTNSYVGNAPLSSMKSS